MFTLNSISQNVMNKEKLTNAEVDGYGWSYVSKCCKRVIYRYNKQNIQYIPKFPYDSDDSDEEDLRKCVCVMVENVYRRRGDEWDDKGGIWLFEIGSVYSIEDAMKKGWGKYIVRKRYRNGLFRFALLRMYILRYIRHLRHIIWMPGSKSTMLLEQEFYRRNV